MREERAQGTVEYAVVLLGFMALVAALALVWEAGHEGSFVASAALSASHALSPAGALDIALF